MNNVKFNQTTENFYKKSAHLKWPKTAIFGHILPFFSLSEQIFS